MMTNLHSILSCLSHRRDRRRLLASGPWMLASVFLVALAAVTIQPARADAASERGRAAGAEGDASVSPTLKPKHAPQPTELGKPSDGTSSLLTTVGSLAIVLGLFLAVVWAVRRSSRHFKLLPKEVFEVLGFAPMVNRQQAVLVRCGNKLLLVMMSAAKVEPFAEITDPAEVERLTKLCHQVRPTRANDAFRQVFEPKEGRDAG